MFQIIDTSRQTYVPASPGILAGLRSNFGGHVLPEFALAHARRLAAHHKRVLRAHRKARQWSE